MGASQDWFGFEAVWYVRGFEAGPSEAECGYSWRRRTSDWSCQIATSGGGAVKEINTKTNTETKKKIKTDTNTKPKLKIKSRGNKK